MDNRANLVDFFDLRAVMFGGYPGQSFDDIVPGKDRKGTVCVYKTRGTNTVRIQNKLSSKRKFSVIVYYNSPNFPP